MRELVIPILIGALIGSGVGYTIGFTFVAVDNWKARRASEATVIEGFSPCNCPVRPCCPIGKCKCGR